MTEELKELAAESGAPLYALERAARLGAEDLGAKLGPKLDTAAEVCADRPAVSERLIRAILGVLPGFCNVNSPVNYLFHTAMYEKHKNTRAEEEA